MAHAYEDGCMARGVGGGRGETDRMGDDCEYPWQLGGKSMNPARGRRTLAQY